MFLLRLKTFMKYSCPFLEAVPWNKTWDISIQTFIWCTLKRSETSNVFTEPQNCHKGTSILFSQKSRYRFFCFGWFLSFRSWTFHEREHASKNWQNMNCYTRNNFHIRNKKKSPRVLLYYENYKKLQKLLFLPFLFEVTTS